MRLPLRVLGKTIDLMMIIGAAAVVLMMLHITASVVAKYVFRAPLPGMITIVSNYYMILVVFLPLAFTERRNGHISVEVLVEHFSKRWQHGLGILAMVFGAVLFGVLAWQSFIEAERARAVGAFTIEQHMRVPIWPARYLLPLGAALMVLTLIAKVVLTIRRGQRQDPAAPYF